MAESCALVSAREATLAGVDVTFSPMVDLVRGDSRWGRVMESTGESTTVSAIIKNCGKVDGEEVIQLYIRDTVATFARPVKQLKGYKRVFLRAGESATVTFPVGEEQLSYYNDKGERVLEKGAFELMLGASSDDVQTLKIQLV